MSEIKSIYIAGKMQEEDWRLNFFDTWYTSRYEGDSHATQLGINPVLVESNSGWPKNTDPERPAWNNLDYGTGTICGLYYTGPFFVDVYGGHGYGWMENYEHGANIQQPFPHSQAEEEKREEVQRLCLDAIKRADLIFAWIDCIDCYGTIAEIGYAKALGKHIWIAGPIPYHDLWFVYAMADTTIFACNGPNKSPDRIFRMLWNDHKKHSRYYEFDSPIEQKFWDTWNEGELHQSFELEPQYPIGKYFVDFAHLDTKTAIELDGFASHSSTEDIAKDRKRQREIEELGWHVIRFGGKEIHSNIHECVREAFICIRKRMEWDDYPS